MGMGVQCFGEDDVTSFLFCVVNSKLRNDNFAELSRTRNCSNSEELASLIPGSCLSILSIHFNGFHNQ